MPASDRPSLAPGETVRNPLPAARQCSQAKQSRPSPAGWLYYWPRQTLDYGRFNHDRLRETLFHAGDRIIAGAVSTTTTSASAWRSDWNMWSRHLTRRSAVFLFTTMNESGFTGHSALLSTDQIHPVPDRSATRRLAHGFGKAQPF